MRRSVIICFKKCPKYETVTAQRLWNWYKFEGEKLSYSMKAADIRENVISVKNYYQPKIKPTSTVALLLLRKGFTTVEPGYSGPTS